MQSALLESYRQYGFGAIKDVDDEEILFDHDFRLNIIPLVVERDDEIAFAFLIDKIWGGYYYKGLITSSLKQNTTKYLQKVIELTELMLLEEVDEGDNYSLKEVTIVAKAYLAIVPFESLWNLSNKGVKLTTVLTQLHADV